MVLNRRNDVMHPSCKILAALPLAAACGLESQGEPSGGVILAATAAVRGVAVVGSDFASSTISLLGVDGRPESASFISSASTDPGLSAALGGDVVLPTTTLTGDEMVLIDRFPTAILTWVSLSTAQVRAQLSVATGYASNPHDYVPYSASKAFVPRFEPNLMPGAEPFDGGSDVLVVDPRTPAIVDRIDIAPAFAGVPGSIYARPDRALMAGGKLQVLAVGSSADFTASADSRLVTIDPESHAIESTLIFTGLDGCGSAEPSPDGSVLAVACTGIAGADPAAGFADSGVVLVSVPERVELARWTSASLGVGQINNLAWLDADHLGILTFGRFNADGTAAEASDEARTLSLATGELSPPWLTAGPFSLGDIACSLGDAACLLADAETDGGVVHSLSIAADGAVTLTGASPPDTVTGLPPRSLGMF
jgi:hypothetical protein